MKFLPTIVDKARNFHYRLSRGLVLAGRQQRGKTNILTSRMFTNPSRNHAQRSFVMFFAGVARAEL